jgi:hypothetical protein
LKNKKLPLLVNIKRVGPRFYFNLPHHYNEDKYIPKRERVYNELCEIGPVRPPSEAYSLLIRATRNCPWNRCRFCYIYKGSKFSLRPVEEIKQEIIFLKNVQDRIKLSALHDYGGNLRSAILAVLRNPSTQSHYNVALWMSAGGKTAFLQDADAIIIRTPDFVEILKFLRQELSSIIRVTSYGRSHTVVHKSLEELKQIYEAGLDRLHVGLESGSDTILKMMDKGVTSAQQIAGGRKVVESGISLSEYVLLGLGGQGLWKEHATETAKVLNAINPDFIRIRSLAIYASLEICKDVESGTFISQTNEGMVEELRVLIENLDCTSNLASDNYGNMLQDVEGTFPQDKEKMLAIINRFQLLTPEKRLHFMVGRRAGIYTGIDEMKNKDKYDTVAEIIERLRRDAGEINDDLLHELRLRYN